MPSIGVQCYTVRDLMKDKASATDTLKKIKALGYDAVEAGGWDPEEYKGMLAEAGIACMGIHTGADRVIGKTDEVKKELETLGAKTVGVSYGADSADAWKEFASKMSKAAKEFKKDGMSLSYHNHQHEFIKFGKKTAYEILVEESDPELCFQVDLHWVARGGGEPAAWVKRLKGRVPTLHFKDMAVGEDKSPQFAEVGEGNLNWPAILEAAKESGTEWYVVEQDQCPLRPSPLDSLKISRDNLKSWGL